jgi:hypothetical protein
MKQKVIIPVLSFFSFSFFLSFSIKLTLEILFLGVATFFAGVFVFVDPVLKAGVSVVVGGVATISVVSVVDFVAAAPLYIKQKRMMDWWTIVQ